VPDLTRSLMLTWAFSVYYKTFTRQHCLIMVRLRSHSIFLSSCASTA